MTSPEEQFWQSFPRRLHGARKMAGLSYRELSERMNRRVSYQTLSNWEKGRVGPLPPMEILQELGKVLGVRYDFFLAPVREAIPQPDFRNRKSRLAKKEEQALLEQALFAIDRYLELEELVGVVVKVSNPLSESLVENEQNAERAAEQLREAWGLGLNPIPQVVEMLEEKGIRVIEADGPDLFDGLAAWVGGIPFMLVNRDREDVCRRRFTLAHELGHLLIRYQGDRMKTEALCDRFASALLLPSRPFGESFGTRRKHLSLEELVGLKEEWGVSLSCLARRARDLDFISRETYTRFMINYRKRGLSRGEPGCYAMAERPTRFRQLLFRAYAEEIISGTKAAYLANQSYEEFRSTIQIVA